jgi:hypothetical protein
MSNAAYKRCGEMIQISNFIHVLFYDVALNKCCADAFKTDHYKFDLFIVCCRSHTGTWIR